MTWFRVDDGFYDHPKVAGLPMASRGLWVTAGAYCARHLTDGHITSRQIRREGGTTAQAKKLLDCGLWEVCTAHSGCYVFHDWDDAQPRREAVLTRRAGDAERKRKAREAKAAQAETVHFSSGSDQKQNESKTKPEKNQNRIKTESNSQKDYYQHEHGNVRADGAAESALPDPTRPDHKEKEPTYVGSSAHETFVGEREAARGPVVHVDAWKIVRQEIPADHPQAVKADLAIRAGGMLRDGTPEADVRAALALWLTKPALGPGTLPALVSEIVRTRTTPARAAPGIGKPTQKALAYLDAAEQLIRNQKALP